MEVQVSENSKLNVLLQGREDFFQSVSAHSPLPGATFQKHDKQRQSFIAQAPIMPPLQWGHA